MKNSIQLIIYTIALLQFNNLSAQTCNNLSGIEYISTNGNQPGNWPGTFEKVTFNNRLFRDGNQSECVPVKSCPGNLSSNIEFHSYKMMNLSQSPSCVTVMMNTDACGTDVHLFAVLGDFIPPACPSANFLGDVGSSLSQPFSFNVPANAQFTLVAQSNFSSTLNCSYGFSISTTNPNARITCANYQTPSLGQWGLILFVLILMGVSSVYVLQRQLAFSMQGAHTSSIFEFDYLGIIYSVRVNFKQFILNFALTFSTVLLFLQISIRFFNYSMMEFDVMGCILFSLILSIFIHYFRINKNLFPK